MKLVFFGLTVGPIVFFHSTLKFKASKALRHSIIHCNDLRHGDYGKKGCNRVGIGRIEPTRFADKRAAYRIY